MDGSAGLPRGSVAVDLPCTTGYLVNGTINAAGELETTQEGVVYESVVFFLAEGETVRMELSYMCEKESSTIEVINDEGVVVDTIALLQGDHVATMHITGPHSHKIRIRNNNDADLTIGPLEMIRMSNQEKGW